MALLRSPGLRDQLSSLIATDGSECKLAEDSPLIRVGVAFSDANGTHLSEEFICSAIASLDFAMGPTAILDSPRIRVSDLPQADVDEVVRRVAQRAVPEGEVLDEPTVNARLGVLVEDIAYFRRQAVDTGILARTNDGARYMRQPNETGE